jgi:uncharacterized protein (TIGR01777 family)
MVADLPSDAEPRRILLAGASGMIGTPLRRALVEAGHTVHTLVRRTPQGPSEHQWDPDAGTIDSGIIDHIDVVLNLSGASIGKIPWTKRHKNLIMSSRVSATRTLAAAITQAENTPSLLIQGSAVGFYGDRGNEELTEFSPRGPGFLADVVEAWEAEAQVASSKKTRVCCARTGLVVGRGGALAPLALQTQLGVGGNIGPGTQWWPWISLHDEVRALSYLVTHDTDQTLFNLVGPTPATATDLTKELARALRRPHLLGLPTIAIKALMGEAGEELLLSSQRVINQRLDIIGFRFDDVTIADAIARMLGRR